MNKIPIQLIPTEKHKIINLNELKERENIKTNELNKFKKYIADNKEHKDFEHWFLSNLTKYKNKFLDDVIIIDCNKKKNYVKIKK